MRYLGIVLTALLFAASAFAPSAFAQPAVLRYSFSDTTLLPDILDQTMAANDATAGPLAILVDDVPSTGVPVVSGNRCLDSSDTAASSATTSGAVTNNTLLLSNTAIVNEGGFTMECWFKWNGGGTINSVIDYAGTEKIVIDQSVAGAAGEVSFRMDGAADIVAGTTTVGEWHYIAIVFETSGQPNPDGSINGTVTTYFDDSASSSTTAGLTKTTFGDSLVRGIGFGMHPLGFDLDFFDGRIYEPRITLGVLPPDQLLFDTAPVGDLFVRSDANSDGAVDISDAVYMLAALFISGAPPPPCAKSGDANDDGAFDISDAVYTLAALFIPGSPTPPAPHPNCGVDPTADPLECVAFPACP